MGKVYLVLHLELMEYRAMKKVAKKDVRYKTFREEALLLKALNHPGIPIIYDIEEDEEYSYLIEEYLQGQSLEMLVKSQPILSPETAAGYVVQLCSVIQYLHSAGTSPILHLDLQPKNIFVCHQAVKLIDFDQASSIDQANKRPVRYGTPGFCAPEQYRQQETLDERTDIYAIGALFYYLLTKKTPEQTGFHQIAGQISSKSMAKVISRCLAPEPDQRYPHVDELKQEIQKLLNEAASSLCISVFGLDQGTGVTHLSLALSAFLWQRGIPNLYEESHFSYTIRRMQQRLLLSPDRYGIIRFCGCLIRPYYKSQVVFSAGSYPVIIRDRGVYQGHEEPGEQEIYVLVAGGKWWDKEITDEAAGLPKDKQAVVFNFTDKRIKPGIPKGLTRENCFQMPWFTNPFYPGKEVCCWLSRLWKQVEKMNGKEKKEPWFIRIKEKTKNKVKSRNRR